MNVVTCFLICWLFVSESNNADTICLWNVAGDGKIMNELDIYLKICQDIIQNRYLSINRTDNERITRYFNCLRPCNGTVILFYNSTQKTVLNCLPNCYKILFDVVENSTVNEKDCLAPCFGRNAREADDEKVTRYEVLLFLNRSSENDSSIPFPVLPVPEALSYTDDVIHLQDEAVTTNMSVSLQFNVKDISFVSDKVTAGPKEDATSQIDLSEARRVESINNSSDVYQQFRANYPVEDWKSLGLFTDDYLYVINSHWLQYQPPSRRSHYILAALYALVMTVGLFGNTLVIFMFVRCRSLRTPANILVMNLAVSDFCLLAKMPIFIFNSLHFGPALGAVGCEVYGFVGGLTGTSSIMTLAAIALDRYYVIVYPLERRTTRQRARICVIFVWCYGTIFSALPLTGLGMSQYVPEGYLTSCSFDYLDQTPSNRIFILIFFFAAWMVPFIVITFSYTNIYRVVISGSSGASSRRGQEHEKRKTELRLAGVVIGVVGLWFVAWTPYAVVALLGISGNAHLISPVSSMIPALFCKTASCIDPFIYAVTHPRFRKEFKMFFTKYQSRKTKLGGTKRNTQCWKTEASRISGLKLQPRKTYDSYSEEEIEEMVVIVADDHQKHNCFTNSSIAPEIHNLSELKFPIDFKVNQNLQCPSWFASPTPKRDRSTSLRAKSKNKEKHCQPDPISV